jgi:hypothetical protein
LGDSRAEGRGVVAIDDSRRRRASDCGGSGGHVVANFSDLSPAPEQGRTGLPGTHTGSLRRNQWKRYKIAVMKLHFNCSDINTMQ